MNLSLLTAVLLQDEAPGALAALGFGTLMAIFLVFYAFGAICFMKIAEKTNTDNGWWAWIPILNIILMLNIARKPVWWIILMLIPLVNFIILILVFVAICQARGKSPAWVVAWLIPGLNLIALGYLAFSE